MLSEKYISQYKTEIAQALEQLKQDAPFLWELQYFFEEVEKYFSLSESYKDKLHIIIWGTSFPEEIVYAFGMSPCFIAGGSLAVSSVTDNELPRDTDPVSRSSYGILINKLKEKTMVIIPITDDSSRKISYILKTKGVKVHTVDIPPNHSSLSKSAWSYQTELCIEAIEKHLKKPFFNRSFKKARSLVYEAKTALLEFAELSRRRTGLISDTLRMFIIYSYYCTSNITEWTKNLRQLNDKIEKFKEDSESNRSSVLLAGSPVYFPNFKIPYLLNQAGLKISANIDYAAVKALTPIKPNKGYFDFISNYYENDCSSAYAKNDRFCGYVLKAADKYKPDGIVFHILKGQIEYDYKLSRIENMLGERNISLFRLETDYNKQDIEQLRIRAEAFGEVLQQRKFTEVSPI